jgi:hypothetical protein
VAQHKTPQAPRLTRKNFDRKMPDAGRHLLAAELEVAGRQLLQGVRAFSSIQQHKVCRLWNGMGILELQHLNPAGFQYCACCLSSVPGSGGMTGLFVL